MLLFLDALWNYLDTCESFFWLELTMETYALSVPGRGKPSCYLVAEEHHIIWLSMTDY